MVVVFFFQAEDGIRDGRVTGVQTCALPISLSLTLPALAGCNGAPTSASAATTALASVTPSTPLATLSTGQAAAVTQNVLPTLAVSNDVQTAVADAEDLLQQLGPNGQGS